MIRAAVALAVALACAGCPGTRYHRDTNAPGDIDIHTPPPSPRAGHHQRPGDPGEVWTSVSPGVFGGAAIRAELPDNDAAVGEVGVLVRVNRGQGQDRSHEKDDFLVMPRRGWGGSLGWSFLETHDGDVTTGAIFAEAHRFRWSVFGAGAGYVFDPANNDHGAQLSGWIGPYVMRFRVMAEGGFGFHIGGQLELPFVWTRSR